jgi:hypothetical protein
LKEKAMRIVCLFNLKPGINPATYEAWARQGDIPAVNALAYVEVIDITGMDAFVADVTTPAFQALAAPFQDFADNPIFILTEDL